MKTLDEHNKEMMKKYNEIKTGLGVLCPDCGLELYDPQPGLVLLSDPPQVKAVCECGYAGFMTV